MCAGSQRLYQPQNADRGMPIRARARPIGKGDRSTNSMISSVSVAKYLM
jgi:hypothetical protein